MLTHKYKLNKEGLQALEIMLLHSQDLATAYHLKELFYDFMDSSTRAEAAKKLRFFILAAQASELKEFHACLTMLGNWSKYILNTFDCSYTNGYNEGTNSAIKVIKRNAFGYRNFENFRNRIFLSLVVGLDHSGFTAQAAFHHIRINGSLHQEIHSSDLLLPLPQRRG